MLAGLLLGGLLLQQLVHVQPTGLGLLVVLRGNTVVHEPGKVVAHAGLPSLEAE